MVSAIRRYKRIHIDMTGMITTQGNIRCGSGWCPYIKYVMHDRQGCISGGGREAGMQTEGRKSST